MTDPVTARRLFGGLPVASVATVGPDGAPHVVPLWFVWMEDAIYVSTRRPSRTWSNVWADPRVALTLDLGRSWVELAGIEVVGRADALLAQDAEVRQAMSAWHEKYRALLVGDGFGRFAQEIEHLAFLRVAPSEIRDWDHVRD